MSYATKKKFFFLQFLKESYALFATIMLSLSPGTAYMLNKSVLFD